MGTRVYIIRELRRVNPEKIICLPRVSTYLHTYIYVCVYVYTMPLGEEEKNDFVVVVDFFSYLLFILFFHI